MFRQYHVHTLIVMILFVLGSTKSNAMTYPKMKNKIIPKSIEKEVLTALRYYPQLANTEITFVLKPSLKKSVMKAQPVFSSLLKPKKNRSYVILISQCFSIDGLSLDLTAVPQKVLIGWLGHELGHIVDYKDRSSVNLFWFGVQYVFFGNFIRKAEIAADTHAVNQGLKEYILATKEFILSHADLSDAYKNRIKRLYMSPDAILELVKEKEAGIHKTL